MKYWIQLKDYFLTQIQSLNRTLTSELDFFKQKSASEQKAELTQIEHAKKDLQRHRKELDDISTFYRQIMQKEKLLKNQFIDLERNANSKIALAESKIESLTRATQTHGHANMGIQIQSIRDSGVQLGQRLSDLEQQGQMNGYRIDDVNQNLTDVLDAILEIERKQLKTEREFSKTSQDDLEQRTKECS